jgi:MFS family permease
VPWPSALRALDHPDFRRFWSGQLLSLVGTWMQSVAQAWLVLQLTGSPLRLGLIGTLQFGPILLLAVVAGAVADRLPKRRLLLATQLLLALQTLVLAVLVWTGVVRYWHVAALALGMGITNAADMPTRQSFIVELVGRADLPNAVALNSAAFNAARVVGPVLAGLLIARVGLAPAFFLNSLSFGAVLVALLLVGAEGRPPARPRATLAAEIGEGLRYARGTPRIALVLALLFSVSVCVFNWSITVPLLAREVLGVGADGLGFLMAGLGVGAVAGALTLAGLGAGPPSLTLLFAAATAGCVGTIALASVRDFTMGAVLLGAVGFVAIAFAAGSNSTLQLLAPDELRGRVMSLHTLGFAGGFPVGSALVGALAEAFGVRAAFVAMGGAGLVAVAALGLTWARRGEG